MSVRSSETPRDFPVTFQPFIAAVVRTATAAEEEVQQDNMKEEDQKKLRNSKANLRY
jgi:hypothetical protein